jgi:hypothetical protein
MADLSYPLTAFKKEGYCRGVRRQKPPISLEN